MRERCALRDLTAERSARGEGMGQGKKVRLGLPVEDLIFAYKEHETLSKYCGTDS